ncbi:MAG: CDP-alcohol phosphatidyltransferase family protein [Bryobacteraceae bacterium]
MRQLPHLLTLCRLAAAPFLAWLLLQSRFREALGVVLVAGLTDWFDGFAARRLHVSGRIGAILDPIADKTLLVTLFLTIGYMRLVPEWLIYLVIGRDVVIVAGALLLRFLRGIRRFLPSTLGKVSTFFQILLVMLVLVQASFPHKILLLLQNIALLLCALFTFVSGLDYVRRGIEMSKADAGRASKGEL